MSEDISIMKAGNWRVFVQVDGPTPANPYEYVGCLSLAGLAHELGEETPVYCPSRNQPNAWDIVDTVSSTPGLPTTDFTQHADQLLRDFWWDIRRRGCRFNGQALVINCTRPDNFNDWSAKILMKRLKMTAFNGGEMNPLAGDGNAAWDLTGSLMMDEFDVIYPLKFGEVADSVMVAEALDGFYYDIVSCGECGENSDGCQRAYILTSASGGSPGLSSRIVHTSNGTTWTAVDIPPLAGNSGIRFAAAGRDVIVLSGNLAQHFVNTLANVDADSTSGWVTVTTGYVTLPQAVYVKSPAEVWIAGRSGYIYFSSNPRSSVSVISDGSITAQHLNDVHGIGNTVVFVGNSNAIVASENGGASFFAVTGPAAKAGVNITAVQVISKKMWWIGYADGSLYFTTNGGTTWTLVAIDSTIQIVNDLKFVNDVIGYLVVETSTGPRVYRTTDGGFTWTYDASHPNIQNLPTAVRYNFAAPCGWNKVLAGGRKAVGGDGIAAVAS